MSLDNVQALPLGTRLGDYRLDAVIGHGGFGITYRAFDTQLAKFVAIKEYLPVECAVRTPEGEVVPRAQRLAEDFAWGRERFLDEARALARFRHPHIVPVLRYFEANGTAYTVMEFEDGRSVAELLRGNRPLPPADVQTLCDGLLAGLAAVHAQGFLHRDVKPSNIIVRRDGVPVLIDFGAARQAMGGRTQTLTGVLTPQYAPIEQYVAEGRQGPWSDIYSAAAVLHHAIAGVPPPEAAARIGNDPYKPLAVSHADRFDLGFLAAIDRALSLTASQRPQSIDEWRALIGLAPPQPSEQLTVRMPTQTIGAARTALGGVSRDEALLPYAATPRQRRRRSILVTLLILATVAAFGWRYRDDIQARLAAAPSPPPPATAEAPPAVAPVPPVATPAPTPTPQPPPPDDSARKALIEKSEKAAGEAKAALELAEEAAARGRAMAGEARIAAARAARPDLENSERLSYDNGASYIGQSSDGKRQGLGVADLRGGERQAGEWNDDRLHGLGTVRLADDARYSGQWKEGQSTGAGVRERPGVDRSEGIFVDGELDGPGLRRIFGTPDTVQAGKWQAGKLEGAGVETIGDRERYEGEFRSGQRHGHGVLVGADGVGKPGRWEEGKLVESAP
ncbi:MAG TPA: protein kinase [Reyranellaceae bacterium]|nr:protein kinase [Reyranellaceae bacterium]